MCFAIRINTVSPHITPAFFYTLLTSPLPIFHHHSIPALLKKTLMVERRGGIVKMSRLITYVEIQIHSDAEIN